MTRRLFLRTIPFLPLRAVYGEPKTTKTIPLLSFHAAGVQFHDFSEKTPPLNDITLLRESDNYHDTDAIALHIGGEKLGYVPKGKNCVLAALMDGSQSLFARITEIDPEAPTWERYRVEIRMEGVG